MAEDGKRTAKDKITDFRLIGSAVLVFVILLIVVSYCYAEWHSNYLYERAMSQMHAHEKNKASTIFSAAQTYMTEYYAKNDGSIAKSVTCEDLYNSGLLTRMPDSSNVKIVLSEDMPMVLYVEYDGYKYPEVE